MIKTKYRVKGFKQFKNKNQKNKYKLKLWLLRIKRGCTPDERLILLINYAKIVKKPFK